VAAVGAKQSEGVSTIPTEMVPLGVWRLACFANHVRAG
jgi:hypothetical protein